VRIIEIKEKRISIAGARTPSNRRSSMRIGILGSGLMGGKLGTIALLVAQLAYEGKGGPELAYRFEWLGK
jgi:hypothetical protein